MPLARCALLVAATCLLASSATAADKLDFTITVKAGKFDRRHVPIVATLDVPPQLQSIPYFNIRVVNKPQSAAVQMIAQQTAPGLTAAGAATKGTLREIHFVLPSLDAGDELQLEGSIDPDYKWFRTPIEYAWKSMPGNDELLSFDTRPVLDYIDQPLDESSKDSRFSTFKPYHQLYDPEGNALLTKGLGGLYPHHRGLFFGYNKVTYGDNKHADVWHCTGDCFQSPEKIIEQIAGPLVARQLDAIDWHGEKKEVFAHELRQMTVYRLPGGVMLDFTSRVSTADGKVTLDGDPQHSGFHFRASETVHTNEKQTYFVRESGVDKQGVEINWDPKKTENDPHTINQPWKGMSFVIDGQRYTVAMLDQPENPKEARFSERIYGRFGSYFKYELTPDHPLLVHYRVWAQRGEMTPDQIATLGRDFADPPKVTAKLNST